MRARLLARLRMPSPGMLVAVVALVVALGGTAYAATATIVNIADPTTPANKAHVTAAGQLQTMGSATVSGTVAETIPRSPFFGEAAPDTGAGSVLIAANKATVALTRLDFSNYYDESETADFDVSEVFGSATTCDGSSGYAPIGSYEVQPGETLSQVLPTPIVLKPFVAGDVWCLRVTVSYEGDPTSYYVPEVDFSGYVVSGSLPPGTVLTRSGKPGVEQQQVRRGH